MKQHENLEFIQINKSVLSRDDFKNMINIDRVENEYVVEKMHKFMVNNKLQLKLFKIVSPANINNSKIIKMFLNIYI